MKPEELKIILDKHIKWLNSENDGERANLSDADLRFANLSDADLSSADLRFANLSKADLSSADLRFANLSDADLSSANLRKANLSDADLSDADLSDADLSSANLRFANLSDADLSSANLSKANLSDADLSKADLSSADLSNVKGLLNPIEWMSNNFKTDHKGHIVYKAFGETSYTAPDSWKIEAGSFIEEVVNQLPTVNCACGVNFATLEWINNTYKTGVVIWKCRINWKDACSITVPYNTDGKARCGRLELLEVVECGTPS